MSDEQNLVLKKSLVWDYFERNKTEKKVTCKVCKKIYKDFGNTTNLITHLRAKHPLQFKNIQENKETNVDLRSHVIDEPSTSNNNQIKDASDTNTSDASTAKRKRTFKQLKLSSSGTFSKNNQKEIDSALIKMICTDLQPLQIVENKGFVNFVATLNNDYVLPNRKTLSEKYLPEHYQVQRTSLSNMLDAVKDIALTTDMWSSDSNKCYLTITAHFIFESKLHARTLTTTEVKDVHSSVVISQVLEAALEEWKILDKVVTIVTDNASNMKNAISNHLNKRNHYCVAHTLNLTIMDCKKANLQFTTLLSKCHTLVKFFKQSSKAAYKLSEIQEQMNAPIIKLKQEVVTRWNSSFLMMERLLKTKMCLSAVLSTLTTAPENLTASEWEQVEDCVNVLKPVEQLTTILSGEKYPTLSSVIPLIRNVQNSLLNKTPITDLGNELKNTLLNQIAKRLGVIENNETAAKATLLDPRYKKAAFGLESNAEKAYQWVSEELGTMIRQNTSTDPETSAQSREIPSVSAATTSDAMTTDSDDLWQHFDQKISARQSAQSPVSSATLMMKQYIDLPNLDRKHDPILYWEQRKKIMPELYIMAMKYLCIPATSVPAERVFSKAALVCNQRRNRLDAKKVDEIIFLNSCDF